MPIFVKTEIIKKEFISKNKLKKKLIDKHKLWIKELKKAGVNIKSGFLVNKIKEPGAGGLLIIEVNTYEEALKICLLYTSPSPRDLRKSRMPSSA